MEAYEPIHDTDREHGMLTRDYIAIQAMAVFIPMTKDSEYYTFEWVASDSYRMADAMIAESNKKEVL